MAPIPTMLAYRMVGEWTLRSQRPYRNPFTDVTVDAAFTGPSGQTFSVPGFHDGDGSWRVRLPVSPCHPPDGYSAWQTRRTWPCHT